MNHSISSSDPCCTHTRKEHSLGVMKLSGKLVKMIMKNQKKLGLTKMDVLCVMLAGLCHDLGHGERNILVYAIYKYTFVIQLTTKFVAVCGSYRLLLSRL